MEGGKSHLMEHPKLFIRFPCNVVYAGIHGKFVNIRHILICHIKNLAKLLIIKNKGVFSQQKEPVRIRAETAQDLHVPPDLFHGMNLERVLCKVAEPAFRVAASKGNLQGRAVLFAWRQIDRIVRIDGGE